MNKENHNSFLLIDDYTYIETVRIGVEEWLNKNRDIVSYSFIPSLRGEVIIKRKRLNQGKKY